MVAFVSYERAKEVSRAEPVVFAEVVGRQDGATALKVHVAVPDAKSVYEIERDDTGSICDAEVHDFVARIAEANGARYAAVYPVRTHWPPRDSKD